MTEDPGKPAEITDKHKKLLAFEIAEAAKENVRSWARSIAWTFAIAVGILGVKTVYDIQTFITKASNEQIAKAEGESSKSLAAFQQQQASLMADFQNNQKTALKKFSDDSSAALKQALDGLEVQAKDLSSRLRMEVDAAINDVRKAREAALVNLSDARQLPEAEAGTDEVIRVRDRIRPVHPGLSIGWATSTASSICCVVQDSAGKRFLVVSTSGPDEVKPGQIVLQPAPGDGGKEESDAIGTIVKAGDWAALVQLNDDVKAESRVPAIGLISAAGKPAADMIVQKFGRTTAATTGQIVDVNTTINVSTKHGSGVVPVPHVIGVRGVARAFSQGGDSGAPVVAAGGIIVGMVFAASDSESYVLSIQPILDEFKVTLVTASETPQP